MKEIIFERITDFNVGDIFDCGQAFRWNLRPDGSYEGVVGERVAIVSFQENGDGEGFVKIQIAESDNEAERINVVSDDGERGFWRHYLDLDKDYGEIKRSLSKEDDNMAKSISCGGGTRILNQDPWEILISFIISQRNKIPRIKMCVESLCSNFGRSIGVKADENGGMFSGKYFTFPEIETLAGIAGNELRVCKLGYREGYVTRAAQQVLELGGR
jgi:N-glycosylase/DNA lyase